jgi:hypothetical protein
LVEAEMQRRGVHQLSAAMLAPVFKIALGAGYGREDFSAIGKVVRQASGLE